MTRGPCDPCLMKRDRCARILLHDDTKRNATHFRTAPAVVVALVMAAAAANSDVRVDDAAPTAAPAQAASVARGLPLRRPTNVSIVFDGLDSLDAASDRGPSRRTVLGVASIMERGGPLARIVEAALAAADTSPDDVPEVRVHVQRDMEPWPAARRTRGPTPTPTSTPTPTPTRWLSPQCDAEQLHSLLFFAFTASAKTLDELLIDTKRFLAARPRDHPWIRRDCARALEWFEGGFSKPAACIAAAFYDSGLEALDVAASIDLAVRIEEAAHREARAERECQDKQHPVATRHRIDAQGERARAFGGIVSELRHRGVSPN